ncbi:potassium/sodium hyperpolarization-activated cyclic nucleotide-gated channel 2-like [Prinia subflava]|uniref:potassium/sodium hyperpolarization-activated cyclic nucleotide-gated channel 2-like n=1 Tax=Prinia subflava TaxID=208062 RepID=UPI002FE213B6
MAIIGFLSVFASSTSDPNLPAQHNHKCLRRCGEIILRLNNESRGERRVLLEETRDAAVPPGRGCRCPGQGPPDSRYPAARPARSQPGPPDGRCRPVPSPPRRERGRPAVPDVCGSAAEPPPTPARRPERAASRRERAGRGAGKEAAREGGSEGRRQRGKEAAREGGSLAAAGAPPGRALSPRRAPSGKAPGCPPAPPLPRRSPGGSCRRRGPVPEAASAPCPVPFPGPSLRLRRWPGRSRSPAAARAMNGSAISGPFLLPVLPTPHNFGGAAASPLPGRGGSSALGLRSRRRLRPAPRRALPPPRPPRPCTEGGGMGSRRGPTRPPPAGGREPRRGAGRDGTRAPCPAQDRPPHTDVPRSRSAQSGSAQSAAGRRGSEGGRAPGAIAAG